MLHVSVTQPARVYVDGKAHGQFDREWETELPPGTHEIRVVARKTGRSLTRKVRIDAGGAAQVLFEFK
jgi:hypothetical protein